MATGKKTLHKIFMLIAVAVIIATTLYEYFEGYKDQYFFTVFLMFLNLASWTAIFGLLFDQRINGMNTHFKLNKATQIFMAFVFIICSIANIFITQMFATDRAKDILNTRPTKTTQASVIRIENRGRHGGSPYAIFTYTTDKGIVEQACYNTNSEYYVGETYEVTYSVEYPEMYRMGRRIKNNGD